MNTPSNIHTHTHTKTLTQSHTPEDPHACTHTYTDAKNTLTTEGWKTLHVPRP